MGHHSLSLLHRDANLLLNNTQLKQLRTRTSTFHLDCHAEELKLEEVSKLANNYSIAKESVMKEFKNMKTMGKITDIPEIDGAVVGSELCKIADFWKYQSELTFKKTGLKRKDEDDEDELAQELDMLLTESDCL